MKILPSIRMMLALSSPLLSGQSGAKHAVLPLVANDTACGPALLNRIGTAAEAAGFTIKNSHTSTRMESKPGLDLKIPALVISPLKSGTGQPLVLPVTAALRKDQHITLSFFVVSSQIEKGQEATIHLAVRKRGQGIVVEKTTKILKPGWVPARVTWKTDSDVSRGDLAFEIQLNTAAPIMITFQRAFITGP